MKRLAVFLALLCLAPVQAQEVLDGRNVILVVTEHRTDELSERLHSMLSDYRSQLGLTREALPLVFMGFADSDTERGFYQRLGFKAEDAPVVCMAEWGNPGRFGPKRVYPEAIFRSAEGLKGEHAAAVVLREWLEREGYADRLAHLRELMGGMPGHGELTIQDVEFQANGKPLYVLNARARLRNVGVATVSNAAVRFYCRPHSGAPWTNLGEHVIEKVPGGYMVVRDLVADTRNLPIVNSEGAIQPCEYRVEVLQDGEVSSLEGRFFPSELSEQ